MSNTMIKQGIKSLTKNEYNDFREWFYINDEKLWDDKIKADSDSGNLDFLINEAVFEKNNDKLSNL
jgi:hypothetical protein